MDRFGPCYIPIPKQSWCKIYILVYLPFSVKGHTPITILGQGSSQYIYTYAAISGHGWNPFMIPSLKAPSVPDCVYRGWRLGYWQSSREVCGGSDVTGFGLEKVFERVRSSWQALEYPCNKIIPRMVLCSAIANYKRSCRIQELCSVLFVSLFSICVTSISIHLKEYLGTLPSPSFLGKRVGTSLGDMYRVFLAKISVTRKSCSLGLVDTLELFLELPFSKQFCAPHFPALLGISCVAT